MILPDESGLDLISYIRSYNEFKNIPIIAISVMAEESKKILEGQSLGVIDWISKPIDLSQLATAINKIS